MTTCINLPGIYGSGPEHWQTRWEELSTSKMSRRWAQNQPKSGSEADFGGIGATFSRFNPTDWDEPVLSDWIEALERAVAACARPPVLIAHSLSCSLVPFWAAASQQPVAGAFMVAPVDPESPAFPAAAWQFTPVPRKPLPFPAVVVGSLDDPYASVDYAQAFAADLGAKFVLAGALGHINADSGLGDWPQGQQLLADFIAGLGGGSEDRV